MCVFKLIFRKPYPRFILEKRVGNHFLNESNLFLCCGITIAVMLYTHNHYHNTNFNERCVISKNPLSTSSASWLELLNRGSLRATALSLQAGPHSVFLSLTNSTATGICLYSFITPTCICFFFRLFTQVHLWLTARSRVNIQQLHFMFYLFLK